jgi:uncharacterized protein YecE (DUF72 family)
MDQGIIRIGTCSWTRNSLIESGSFYPDGVVTPLDRLRFYASRFNTVEIDSSYYAIPTPYMAEAWARRTPPGFLFHVRAYGALTGHSIDPRELPRELRELLPAADRDQESVHVQDHVLLQTMARVLIEALEPLKEAHKLGFIVFQFPPWFTCKNANRDYLLYCRELMAGLPIAVEFRHGSWLTRDHREDVFAFLREHKITYITCDEPQFGNLVTAPFHPELTTPIGYVRLHGRNADDWMRRGEDGCGYLYRDDELRFFAAVARRFAAKGRELFIMFNNSDAGHAFTNALQLCNILQLRS